MLFQTLYQARTLMLNLTYRRGLPKTGGHINLNLGMGVNLK